MTKRMALIVAAAALAVWAAPTAGAVTIPHRADYCPASWYVVHVGTNGPDTYTVGVPSVAKWPCYFGAGGADHVTGSTWIDAIVGGGGADVLNGRGGADSIDGQGGNDTVSTTGAPGVLYGGNGSDTVTGGPGEQDIFGGGVCTETSYWGFGGGPSTDPCNVGDGSDHLYGMGGDDWLWESNSDQHGDGVVDYLDGGPGNDFCAAEAIDVVTGCETVERLP